MKLLLTQRRGAENAERRGDGARTSARFNSRLREVFEIPSPLAIWTLMRRERRAPRGIIHRTISDLIGIVCSLRVPLRSPRLCVTSLSVFAACFQVTAAEIDLPTALRLAGAQNLDVRIAQEKLAEARANNAGALLQFFPWVSGGVTYRRHDNLIQDVAGNINEVHKQSYAPGGTLVSELNLGDAIYKKLAAHQLQHAAGHALAVQRGDGILAAARDYYDLLLAQTSVGVAQESVRIATNYQAQLQVAVEAGLAFKGDLLRATVQAGRNEIAASQAVAQRRVAAARLAQTLHLDPAVELTPRETDLVPLPLFATNTTVQSLVQVALASRPELKRSQTLAAAAKADKNGATFGPLLPSISAQAFTGGLGRELGNLGAQQDYFVGLTWRIGPGGLFDFTKRDAAKARLNQSRLGEEKMHDAVVREVVEGFTRMESLSRQIEITRRSLAAAEEGLRLAQQRKEFAVGVVLETVIAEQDLTRARTDYLRAVADFNKALYALNHATGKL